MGGERLRGVQGEKRGGEGEKGARSAQGDARRRGTYDYRCDKNNVYPGILPKRKFFFTFFLPRLIFAQSYDLNDFRFT